MSAKAAPSTPDWFQRYLERGFQLYRYPQKQKGPSGKDGKNWTSQFVTEYAADSNWGVALGAAAGSVLFADAARVTATIATRTVTGSPELGHGETALRPMAEPKANRRTEMAAAQIARLRRYSPEEMSRRIVKHDTLSWHAQPQPPAARLRRTPPHLQKL